MGYYFPPFVLPYCNCSEYKVPGCW